MTQEDKELLLKDLCARLPYNLYVNVEEFNVPKNEAITEGFEGNYLKDNRCNDYDADEILNELADGCIGIKPYLRPMSSMTEEEQKEFVEFHCVTLCPIIMNSCLTIENEGDMFDWLSIDSLKKVKKLQKNLASSKICYLCAVKQLKRE